MDISDFGGSSGFGGFISSADFTLLDSTVEAAVLFSSACAGSAAWISSVSISAAMSSLISLLPDATSAEKLISDALSAILTVLLSAQPARQRDNIAVIIKSLLFIKFIASAYKNTQNFPKVQINILKPLKKSYIDCSKP